LKDPRIREGNAPEASQAAMSALAKNTGGLVVPATNQLASALSRLIQNGAKYYTLSYAPSNNAADGSYRTISVKVKNRESSSYRLSCRRGYYAVSSPIPAAGNNTDPLLPLLQPGLIPSTQIPYTLRVDPLDPQPSADSPRAGGNSKLSGATTRYGIDFRIPHGESAVQNSQTRMRRLKSLPSIKTANQ
jgi:hypothetical protein